MTIVTADWVDATTGTREHAAFETWSARSRCFTVVHRPPGPARAIVVVCSPVLIEQMRNYRREVQLARALASHGVATLRFHYRGTGNSDGDSQDLTLQTMVEDAGAAVRRAPSLVGHDAPLCLLGTRISGLVAASVAPTLPLVLWHPVLRGRSWVREVHRARAVGQLRQDGHAPDEREGDDDREVLGFELTPALEASLATADLVELVGARTGPVLVVDAARRDAGRLPGARLSTLGPHVSPVTVTEDTAGWWFPAALSDDGRDADDLEDLTVEWVAATVATR